MKWGTRFPHAFTEVLIREIPTGRYWERHGSWTSDLGKATSFRDCTAALQEVKNWQLPLVQLVRTRELVVQAALPQKTSVRG